MGLKAISDELQKFIEEHNNICPYCKRNCSEMKIKEFWGKIAVYTAMVHNPDTCDQKIIFLENEKQNKEHKANNFVSTLIELGELSQLLYL